MIVSKFFARFLAPCAVLPAMLLAGCANPLSRQSLDNWSLTYKVDVQQGIVVTQEMVEQLKVGMTRDQVRFVLGTPILTDPFHADRWEYPFRFVPGRGRVEERRFTVYFKSDLLTSYNGDSMPTEEEFAKSRNFATTRIVRALPPPVGGPVTQAPSDPAGNLGSTTVTPGRVVTPDRPAQPNDQTPPSPTSQ
jgi:outer membrane protein assembly factor BamE